ncbi:hypothetical protein ONZ45_g1087 [Pleurotus djamor]|nr:hypothetical protein ONZ45_g1087 [Pleurotus djamor]
MSLEDCLLPLQEEAGDGGCDGYVKIANFTNVVSTLEPVGAATRLFKASAFVAPRTRARGVCIEIAFGRWHGSSMDVVGAEEDEDDDV